MSESGSAPSRPARARRGPATAAPAPARQHASRSIAPTARGAKPVPFHSILFDQPDSGGDVAESTTLAFFGDLYLDDVLASITAGRDEYDLVPLFSAPLRSVATVEYRHDVFRDLESAALRSHVQAFATRMRSMRTHLALTRKLHYARERQRWFVTSVADYCDAVSCLAADLGRAHLKSRGMLAFREHLVRYAESTGFVALLDETTTLTKDLSGLKYSLHLKGTRVTVGPDSAEGDYSGEVEQTFARFQQGAVKDYRVGFPTGPGINHVEAQILERVARLYPEVFQALAEYCTRNGVYLDQTISTFDREVQFYLAYLEYIERFERSALHFCYPRVSDSSKQVCARDAFDVALAGKLVADGGAVVCNDWHLSEPERVFVVSGPNQGGKTTFARTFGQMHYLAAIGCPVPGSDAQLFLFDRLFTHFERQEDLATLRGKLEDELVGLHEILEQATPNSIIIMNESFGSTTLRDSLLLGANVLERIAKLDLLSVYVTFVDELASLGETVVSLTSMVDADDPRVRTYKLERHPADGRAYAAALAEKYGLDYVTLKARVGA
jgi:DNA mismatch repair protein MutS